MQKGNHDRRVLWTLLLAALMLRLFGLSHDLHLGLVYHPDTPKQIRAVEQFLLGDYLEFVGHSDYDGYPYFNSHLVEYLVRAYVAGLSALQHWVGAWTGAPPFPSYDALFWLTRAWNAFLSALAVPLLFVLGRRFNRATAWCVAVLALLSPLDISAAHFASNDTAAAFFGLLALWFGFRIAEAGRLRDLAGGAFCVAAAFSSKYHGAMSILPVMIGHILYCRRHGGVLARPALARWALAGLAGIVSVFLTSPALIVHFDAAFESMLQFFRYTANFALSDEVRQWPAHQRFLLGLRENMPVLVDAVGWPVLLTSFLALFLVLHEPRLALLVGVPLVHVFIGLAGKPYLHQAHHAPVTGYLFLAASAVWLGTAHRWTTARWYRGAVIVLVGWSVLQSAYLASRELMSFHVTDTRRVAQTWILDSFPSGVQWLNGGYTFNPPQHEGPPLPVQAFAQSGEDPHVFPGFIEWARFSHFDNRFSRFVNRDILIHTVANEYVRLPVRLPYLLPVPGESHDGALSLDVSWFGRSTRVRDVERWKPVRAWAVSSQAVHRAWLAVQTATEPVSMTLRFGDHEEVVHLPAGRNKVVAVEDPDRFFIPLDRHCYYRWQADVKWGSARVTLMTKPEEAALWALENRDDELARSVAPMVQGDSFAADLIRAATDPEATDLRREVRQRCFRLLNEPSAWLDEFGMSEAWLSAVPYVAWQGEGWHASADPANGTTNWVHGGLHLTPGHYVMHVDHAGGEGATIHVTLDDGRTLHDGRIDSEGTARFHLRDPGHALIFRLSGLSLPPGRTKVTPDARGMIGDWMEQLDAGAVATNHLESESAEPMAVFDEGIVVMEALLDKTRVRPGGRIDFDFAMWVPEGFKRPDRYSIWVRLVDAGGETVARYDRPMMHFLRDLNAGSPSYRPREWVDLPANLPPGSYEIHLGMWIPAHRKRIKVVDSTREAAERYVVVEKITVGEDAVR